MRRSSHLIDLQQGAQRAAVLAVLGAGQSVQRVAREHKRKYVDKTQIYQWVDPACRARQGIDAYQNVVAPRGAVENCEQRAVTGEHEIPTRPVR